MWALRQPAPFEFEHLDVPAPPPPPPRPVPLRFRLGGICGSDLTAFAGVRNRDNPQFGSLGAPLHELVATVTASTTDRITMGDRIVGTVVPAGLRELQNAPAGQLHPLTTTLPDSEAIVVQPLATVLCALNRLGDLRDRHTAVLGLGPIGMLFCAALKARGATVTGVDRVDRTPAASLFGLDEVVTGQTREWVTDLRDADRPHLVVDAIGHNQDVVADCVDAAAPHGVVYAFGLPEEHYVLPMRRFFRKNLTLRAGGTTDWPAHLAAAEQFLVARRDLARAYVTHTFRLADARDAYLTALRPTAGQLKITLVP